MKDRDLRRALRELPRHGASDGFRKRLLERLDGIDRPRPERRTDRIGLRWSAAAAFAGLTVSVALTLTLAGPLLPRDRSRPPTEGAEDDLAALKAESERLQVELDELERLLRTPARQPVERRGFHGQAASDTADPVLYLGGDDRYDLVLDLERLAARGTPHRTGRTLPTSLRDGSR